MPTLELWPLSGLPREPLVEIRTLSKLSYSPCSFKCRSASSSYLSFSRMEAALCSLLRCSYFAWLGGERVRARGRRKGGGGRGRRGGGVGGVCSNQPTNQSMSPAGVPRVLEIGGSNEGQGELNRAGDMYRAEELNTNRAEEL